MEILEINWIISLILTIVNQMVLLSTDIVQLLSSEIMENRFVSISPAVVATIAIYYAYLKEGEISVGLLHYCICNKQDDDWDIELPLGFYNSGATGKTIMGLRIKFIKNDWTSKPLYCEHILNDIGIGADGHLEKTRKWLKPFIIEPRRGYTDCFSFSIKRSKEDIKLAKGEYKIILEAKFINKKNILNPNSENKRDWKKIDIIDFYIGDENFNCMTVYPNDPDFFAFSYGTDEDSK